MTSLVVDAGPLYAYVDGDDRHHAECLELLTTYSGPLIVPQLVICEAAYLIGQRLGPDAEILFLGDLAGGTFSAEPVHPSDWLRIAELVGRYRDVQLGTADASLVALAERLGVTDVATLDHRHMGVVRPRHVDGFNLLPERSRG
ncbi:MAG TPA: PIN domain-containing protein [Candidatus Dormibacteraeota bacterium]|nr:PIN domain-containing protein [Candidatus Dormibacteraeota bacterium]